MSRVVQSAVCQICSRQIRPGEPAIGRTVYADDPDFYHIVCIQSDAIEEPEPAPGAQLVIAL